MALEGSLKRGKTSDGPVDLISNLPRGVIDVIMEHLPLCDAARMSVLSHYWLDIWRSIQKLVLDAQFFKRVLKDKILDTNEFSRIVSKILFHYSGHLRKFHLYIPSLRSSPDIDQWICYLSRTTGVSDIYIQSQYVPSIKLSSHIFSCANLENLWLHGFRIIPPHNFGGFSKMTCLDLDKTVITGESFNRLVRNCPLLQKLRLTNCFGMDRIVIDFPNLRQLTLDSMFVSLDVKNAANLVSAYFGLHYCHELASHQTCFRLLFKALASSCNLQVLVFKGLICKAFLMEPVLPPVFQKLRKLALTSISLNDSTDFDTIIKVIQRFPAIERLYISVTNSRHMVAQTVDYNPDAALHRLYNADVNICSGSIMELKLIEFVLSCSPVLNRLSISTFGDRKTVFHQKMMNKLIRFRRASRKAEVICPDFP